MKATKTEKRAEPDVVLTLELTAYEAKALACVAAYFKTIPDMIHDRIGWDSRTPNKETMKAVLDEIYLALR